VILLKVSIESIRAMEEFRKSINTVQIHEIEWTLGGRVIEIDPHLIDEFEFTGLSNIDFITTGAYKDE
jgi:hypothetical protein